MVSYRINLFMMNVILINRRYCPGEAWTNRVLAYAKGLAELGAKVSLVYLIANAKRTPYEINIPNVKVIKLWEKDTMIEGKFRLLSYLHNLYRARKLVKTGDKVFVYGAEKPIVKAVSKKGVKVYAEITEHPYIYNKNGKAGEDKIDDNSRRLSTLDGLCVISNKLFGYYSSLGIPLEKLRVSNMFVDIDRFNIKKNIKADPYIAYCGVITYDKDGVDVLIKSFAIFHDVHPEYKLYLIGRAASNEILEGLKTLCKSLGVDESVVFTGQILPSAMPQMLVDAKILALARPNNLQAQNGFPTKLGEYLSTANPVVVTSVGEIPLFIKDGVNGFLAEPDSPESFAEKLIWVADHYEEACRVAAIGRKLAENEFSYKTQSKVLYDLMNNEK